jgi:predicted nucleic acid-binding protein
MLDSNVLYPFLVRDVLLSLAAAGLFRPQWTEEITQEWRGHFLASKPEKAAQIERTIDLMRSTFPEAIIDRYEALIPGLNLPDPNDRHVLAAAIRGGANTIVTNNLKHFPAEELARYDLEPLSPDEFIVNTFQLYPADAMIALRTMRQRYNRPPKTPADLLLSLAGSGLVQAVAELKPYVDTI